MMEVGVRHEVQQLTNCHRSSTVSVTRRRQRECLELWRADTYTISPYYSDKMPVPTVPTTDNI